MQWRDGLRLLLVLGLVFTSSASVWLLWPQQSPFVGKPQSDGWGWSRLEITPVVAQAASEGEKRQSAPEKPSVPQASAKVRKPRMDDTVRAHVYADNWFMLYINGELVAVDSIKFIPHNVIAVDLLPSYPMTIAVMAKDNADPKTGMEYANTNIGDGGFILKFSDGTVTDARWKAKRISWGPVNRDTRQPRVESIPLPENWYGIDFDDSQWPAAREYSQEQIGPKEPFFEYDFQGAKFIWSDDVELDNTVLFRRVVTSPPDGKTRADFSKLNDQVPEQPPRQKKKGKS